MKLLPVEPSWLMWPDGQTDITMLIVAFRNFANAPKSHTYAGAEYAAILPYKNKFYLLLLLLFYFPNPFGFRHYRPYCNSNSNLLSNKPWKSCVRSTRVATHVGIEAVHPYV